MNFLAAMAAVREGKTVKRAGYERQLYLQRKSWVDEHIVYNSYGGFNIATFDDCDIVSVNWEIVEEKINIELTQEEIKQVIISLQKTWEYPIQSLVGVLYQKFTTALDKIK